MQSFQDQLAAKFASLSEEAAETPTADTEATTTAGRFARLVARVSGVETDEVTEDKSASDLGIDSLDRIEIAVRAEEEFGVRVEEEEWLKVVTVGDAVTLLDS